MYTIHDVGRCRRCGEHGQLAKAGRYPNGRQRFRDVCKPCEARRRVDIYHRQNPGAARMILIPASEYAADAEASA